MHQSLLDPKGWLMRYLDGLARLLIVVGGLNWGLVGLFNFDLVFLPALFTNRGTPRRRVATR